MVASRISGFTQETNVTGASFIHAPDQNNVDKMLRMGDLNLFPDGFLVDGHIAVTSSSNNLTLTLKTRQGNNPTNAEPVTVFINGTRRRVANTLSFTLTSGTNWYGSADAETDGLEMDYFARLIWNSNTNALNIAAARVPSGSVYSDFSSTPTDDKYLAYGSGTAPAASDPVICIGRFAATLQLTTYNWILPQFTQANLINYPIYRSNWHAWTPTLSGFAANQNPTGTIYEYRVEGKDCVLRVRQATDGTSNATNFSLTAPMQARTVTNGLWTTRANAIDNGTALTTPSLVSIASGSSTVTIAKDTASAAWTAANGKRVGYFELRYAVMR